VDKSGRPPLGELCWPFSCVRHRPLWFGFSGVPWVSPLLRHVVFGDPTSLTYLRVSTSWATCLTGPEVFSGRQVVFLTSLALRKGTFFPWPILLVGLQYGSGSDSVSCGIVRIFCVLGGSPPAYSQTMAPPFVSRPVSLVLRGLVFRPSWTSRLLVGGFFSNGPPDFFSSFPRERSSLFLVVFLTGNHGFGSSVYVPRPCASNISYVETISSIFASRVQVV